MTTTEAPRPKHKHVLLSVRLFSVRSTRFVFRIQQWEKGRPKTGAAGTLEISALLVFFFYPSQLCTSILERKRYVVWWYHCLPVPQITSADQSHHLTNTTSATLYRRLKVQFNITRLFKTRRSFPRRRYVRSFLSSMISTIYSGVPATQN